MKEEEGNRSGLLSQERVRGRLRRALGVAEPDPGLRSRVVASMPIDVEPGSPRWQWAAGGVAFVLAVAMVATLIVARRGPTTHSASVGRPIGSVNMATPVGFRCSLPVANSWAEARISFPDGGVTIDRPLDSQLAKGGGYDLAYAAGRWLPVQPSRVSPDGTSYAYTTVTSAVPGRQSTSALFVHDVTTGRDRQVWNGEGAGQVLGWGPGGVYFTRQPVTVSGVRSPELWVVDPANRAGSHRVGPAGFQRIAGGAAWGTVYGPVTNDAAGSPIGAPPSRIDRMDLRDGSVTTWYTAPAGLSASVAGVDGQGHPVLFVNMSEKGQAGPPSSSNPQPGVPSNPASWGGNPAPTVLPPPQVLLLTGPNQTRTISAGSDTAFRPNVPASGDSHGIWLSVPGSLWLYRNGSLTKVAAIPSGLFPSPTPPLGLGKGSAPSPPPGYPTGVTLNIAGACT